MKPHAAANSFEPEGVSDEDLFKFAEDAIANLKANCEEFLMDQIVRVDIFFDKVRGCLCVNEFESLEAMVTNTGDNESAIQSKLKAYYKSISVELFESCIANSIN